MRLYIQNFHLRGLRAFYFVSDCWTTVPATYTLLASGVFGYVNFVSYHVGNKKENLLESNILAKVQMLR